MSNRYFDIDDDEVLALWEEDYGYMQRHMIYDGKTLPFVELLQRMKELERRFHEG